MRVVDPKVVARRRRHRRLMALGAVVLVGAMFAVSMAHATLVARQRQLDQLRADIAVAEEARGRLERQVAVASAPDAILDRAFLLGMVRAVDPVYLVATANAGSTEAATTDPDTTDAATTDAATTDPAGVDG